MLHFYVDDLIKSLHEEREKAHTFDQLKYHNQLLFQEELNNSVEDNSQSNDNDLDNNIEENIIEIINN